MAVVIDIISQLQKLEGSFSRREQRVADFVLENLDNIAFLRQAEIAEAAEVSVATVNRFCTTLGCDGFQEFKIRLVQSVAVSLQYMGTSDRDVSGTHHLVGQVFGSLEETLNLARSQLNAKALDQAIEVLSNARRVVFIGVGGGSANVAVEGANRLFRLGIAAEAHCDGYLQRMVASTLGPGDVMFAVSATGLPSEILESVQIARQYGAETISLTRNASPLAAATDTAIELNLPEDQDIFKPSASRLVFMAVIDVLAAGVARKRPDDVREYLRRIRTSLVSISNDTAPKPIGD